MSSTTKANPMMGPVRWQHAGDYGVAVPACGSGRDVLVLNGSAHALAQLCDGTRSEQQIVEEFAAAYGRPPAEVEADVAAFLADLERRGQLGYAGAAGGLTSSG